jgi:hypothetical protein
MTKRTLAVALSALVAVAVAGPLLAHGNYTHVLGTVTAIDADHVEVKTKAGKVVSVTLTGATKYTKDGAAAAAKDMQVGQRVSVEATPRGEALEASEVKLGVMTKAAPAK